MPSVDGQHISTALNHARQRLSEIQTQESRCSCIGMALYFVDSFQDVPGIRASKTIEVLREGLDRNRMNPFASFYTGWFDYSWCGSVALSDAPEFIDRVYRAERAVFQRDFLRFKPTGYDLILCDVTNTPTGSFRFSQATHLSVTQFLALLPEVIGAPGEESPVAGTRTTSAGLLLGRECVVSPFIDYLKHHAPKPSIYPLPVAQDLDWTSPATMVKSKYRVRAVGRFPLPNKIPGANKITHGSCQCGCAGPPASHSSATLCVLEKDR